MDSDEGLKLTAKEVFATRLIPGTHVNLIGVSRRSPASENGRRSNGARTNTTLLWSELYNLDFVEYR
jgi:hypothetical protein